MVKDIITGTQCEIKQRMIYTVYRQKISLERDGIDNYRTQYVGMTMTKELHYQQVPVHVTLFIRDCIDNFTVCGHVRLDSDFFIGVR